ncbi:MAG: glycosyltransferase [Bacteroidales bacterium]
MEKEPVIVISTPQSWDIEIDSTIKNLAREFSRERKVIFMNSPLDHITRLRNPDNRSYRHKLAVVQGKEPDLRVISQNLLVLDFPFMLFSVNKLPWAWLFNLFNYLNNRRIARYLKKRLKALQCEEIVLFADTDIYRSFYLKELLKPRLSVYYKRDQVIGFDYFKRHGVRLEPLLMKKSDLVITNSRYFAEQASEHNCRSFDVETGVDTEAFNPSLLRPEPEDMQQIPHPRIGYFGVIITERLDIALLDAITRQRPDYQFVLVGPEDAEFASHPMHQRKNVWFLGKKDPGEIPAYAQHFDVCFNPQVVNEITMGNYPLKVDQYLALGKPVVATETHTMQHIFSSTCYLANTPEAFATQIDKALHETDNPELRRQRLNLAASHSWRNIADKIWTIIANFLDKR